MLHHLDDGLEVISLYPYKHALIQPIILQAKCHYDPWSIHALISLWESGLQRLGPFPENTVLLPVPRPWLRTWVEGPGVVPLLRKSNSLRHYPSVDLFRPRIGTPFDRDSNQRTFFTLRKSAVRACPATVSDSVLLLVDDVLTTGATLLSLWKLLRLAQDTLGYRRILGLTFASAVSPSQ